MFALGANEYSIKITLIIQFLYLIQPFQTILQTILIGAVIHYHHQIRIFTHPQSNRFVELMPAQVEQEQLHAYILVCKSNYLRVDLSSLRLSQPIHLPCYSHLQIGNSSQRMIAPKLIYQMLRHLNNRHLTYYQDLCLLFVHSITIFKLYILPPKQHLKKIAYGKGIWLILGIFIYSFIMTKKFNLKYFILSQQSLTLYRQFYKMVSKIGDSQTRGELYGQVRGEFERYRNIEDTNKIEYLIVTGRKQLGMLNAYSSNNQ